MEKTKPSFAATSLVVLVVIVLPLAAATLTAILVKEWLSVVLVLLYSLTLLLIVIPYFALVNEQVPSRTWLETYRQILSRIPIIGLAVPNPNRFPEIKNLANSLGTIAQWRIQARDWKFLHQKCQGISLKLIILRGVISTNDLQMVLHDIENYWMDECSVMIVSFWRLDGLPDGLARQEFTSSEHGKRWLQTMQNISGQVDDIVDQCVTTEDLLVHLSEISDALHGLERTSSELLNFLDHQLQRAISELDKDIELARTSIVSY